MQTQGEHAKHGGFAPRQQHNFQLLTIRVAENPPTHHPFGYSLTPTMLLKSEQILKVRLLFV